MQIHRHTHILPEMVFFDLGGVVVDVQFDLFVRQMARLCRISQKEMALQLHGLSPLYQRFATGKITADVLFDRMTRQFPKINDRAVFESFYTGIFRLKEGVTDIITALRTQVRLSVISNTDALHFDYIVRNYAVMQLFEEPVTSFEVHAVKPQAKIFQAALKRFGLQPAAALFIDDREENIAAARNVGMQAIQFESAQQLQLELDNIFPDWRTSQPSLKAVF